MDNPIQIFSVQEKKSIVLKIIIVALALWSIFIIFFFRNVFAGDSEIHIIFARNLLKGHFLEFNQGYSSGGETSPLYMIYVAILYKVLGKLLPYGMKYTSFISLCWISFLIYKINPAKNILLKIVGFLLFTSLCFAVFHSMTGMENFLFAGIVSTIVFIELKTIKSNGFQIFLLSYLSFLLRPEGILIGIFYSLNSILKKDRNALLSALTSLIISIITYKALIMITGGEIYNAGLIRSFISKASAINLSLLTFKILISKKTLYALLYSIPILITIIINKNKIDKIAWNAIFIFVFIPIILHLFLIFPDNHISRYLIYLYSTLFIIFSKYILPDLKKLPLILIATYLLFISFNEFNLRQISPIYSVKQSVNTTMSPAYMKNYSDILYNQLSSTDSDIINIGTIEVQIRGKLDNRFLIWSIDGITDKKLLNYINSGSIDHFQYIKDRSIDYISHLPNYNIDKTQDSLETIKKRLEEGNEKVCFKNLEFSKSIGISYKINHCK
tara:strand:- start:98 stop:1597 length:1500 start_codon:yes stop_codon:yes gene_type:complete